MYRSPGDASLAAINGGGIPAGVDPLKIPVDVGAGRAGNRAGMIMGAPPKLVVVRNADEMVIPGAKRRGISPGKQPKASKSEKKCFSVK